MPSPATKLFSAKRSCVVASASTPGRSGFRPAEDLGGAAGDVLELVGDHVDRVGEGDERRLVVVGPARMPAGDREGGAVGLGAVDVRREAVAGGRKRDHAPELPAADDAEGASGVDHAGASSAGRSATASLCRARQASSRSARAGSASASTAAARSAALIAPALPMASVPTGTPAGIWTIE